MKNFLHGHMLRHLQTHQVDCPICGKSYGMMESLRKHLNDVHKKKMRVMEKEEPELWKKARKPVPCSKDKQYHVKVEKNSL